MFLENNIKNTNYYNYIFLIIISSFLLPRSLVYLGLPSLINHFHYILIFFLFVFSFFLEKKNIIENKLLTLLFFFSLTIFISTLYNGTSFSNYTIYSFIILQPFCLYIFLIKLNFSEKNLKYCKFILFFFSTINSVICYIQYFLYGLRHDSVQGLLVNLGAGHHVAGSLSTITALYIFMLSKFNFLTKSVLIIFFTSVNFLSDSKQVVLSFLIVFLLFSFLKFIFMKNFIYIIKSTLKYLFFLLLIYFIVVSFPYIFKGYFVKSFEEILIGLELKFNVFNYINFYFTNFFNYLFGLGPGSSTSRLAVMIPDYFDLPLFKFSFNELTNLVWIVQLENPITNPHTGSSLFSLFFFWGGLYGDIGLIGCIFYLYLWLILSKINHFDDISSFLIILVLFNGVIFNWPEEPAFVLFVVIILSIRYHQLKLIKK